MKRFNEYSKIELAQVSQEELQTLIELELAYAGILPEIAPTELPPFEAGIKPTEIFYEVFGVLFKNQIDAITVSSMQVASETYDYYGGGYNYKYGESKESTAVSTKSLYKKEDVMRVKSMLSERKKVEDIYAEELKKYNKFMEATSSVRSEVLDAYNEACNFTRKIELAKEMLGKYRELADGNEEIARNFFLNAYKDSLEVVEKVLEKEV